MRDAKSLILDYLFAFCLGFVCMFVLAVDEIDRFKGCPVPGYWNEPVPKTLK